MIDSLPALKALERESLSQGYHPQCPEGYRLQQEGLSIHSHKVNVARVGTTVSQAHLVDFYVRSSHQMNGTNGYGLILLYDCTETTAGIATT